MLSVVEKVFVTYGQGRTILPDKSSFIFDATTQGRINCMPSALIDEGVAGVKWVSVFPSNPVKFGVPNVGGLMVLSETACGFPLAVMDAAVLTSVRTALVDALAAKILMRPGSSSMAILGTGEQARMHAIAFSQLFPTISDVRIVGRNEGHADGLSARLVHQGVPARSLGGDFESAVKGADILVTAISGQEPLLKASWLYENGLYCHVGGWEDEYSVPRAASKIVCDNWEGLKHRGSPTIARMYQSGDLSDEEIHANLDEILLGRKAGRERDDEFIYFNAIGMSIVDVALAAWFERTAREEEVGTYFDFSR